MTDALRRSVGASQSLAGFRVISLKLWEPAARPCELCRRLQTQNPQFHFPRTDLEVAWSERRIHWLLKRPRNLRGKEAPSVKVHLQHCGADQCAYVSCGEKRPRESLRKKSQFDGEITPFGPCTAPPDTPWLKPPTQVHLPWLSRRLGRCSLPVSRGKSPRTQPRRRTSDLPGPPQSASRL